MRWNHWSPSRNKKMKVSRLKKSERERLDQRESPISLCKTKGNLMIEQMTMDRMWQWDSLEIYRISNLNLPLRTKMLIMKVLQVSRIRISLISMKVTLKTWACWRIWIKTRTTSRKRLTLSRPKSCASRHHKRMDFLKNQPTLRITCHPQKIKELLLLIICNPSLPITVGTISILKGVDGK